MEKEKDNSNVISGTIKVISVSTSPRCEKIDSRQFIWEQNLLPSIVLMMKANLGRG